MGPTIMDRAIEAEAFARGDLAPVWGSAEPLGRPGRLLGRFAHPDDEVFCLAGTIARCSQAGASTAIVSLTRGEAGQIRDAAVATRRTLGATRSVELAHAAQALGVPHDSGWDVLVDAAAFAPTNRLDITRIRPDFVTCSFYKIFGFPTGVGCLLMRRDKFDVLARPWFAGGTITIASVQGDGHCLHRDEAAFEDGTVDHLNLPAVETGLQYISRIGLDAIHRRVAA